MSLSVSACVAISPSLPPNLLIRSTFAGSGRYVQHWTGDNVSLWLFLRQSLAEIFNFNLFGVPQVGSDICGFTGDTTAELCARWSQVGVFYPFSRNHNNIGWRSQEPYEFSKHPYVLASIRASLQLKYSLLKYYYSLFVKKNGTGMIFKPLFFEFPADTNLLAMDNEFMLDQDLLGIPVLQRGDTNLNQTTIEVIYLAAEGRGGGYIGYQLN